MKYLAWLSGVLMTLVVGLYILLFTSVGNSIMQPIIETKIQEVSKLDGSKLSIFSLNMSKIEISLELNKNNTISLDGNYSLFSRDFDINYNVKLNELQTLQALSEVELKNNFHTNGKVKGNMAFMEVDGVSDFASSETSYHVALTNFTPTSIIAKVINLKLEQLLDTAAQKQYASADVNLDINFKSIKSNALDGDILLTTNDAKLNRDVMKKDFNISIPSTKFTMNIDAKLKGKDINYKYLLQSNLFKMSSSGNVVPEPLKTDIKYALNIENLALLKAVTGTDMRGSFAVDGSVKGTKEKLFIDGKSNVASSTTTFKAMLKDFQPLTIKANVQNLKLARLLYMMKQPHYTDGIFSMDMDIADVRSGMLDGEILTTIKKGLLDSNYLSKAYEFKTKMPKTTYRLNTKTSLKGDIADTTVALESSLVRLNIQSAKYDLDKSTFLSDYTLTVPKLDKMFFITDKHMRGSIKVNGRVTQEKDLDVTMQTMVAGGKIDALLHNDDLSADIKAVQTLDALHMLIYPEIFKASLDAKLDYNLAEQKGTFEGTLKNGKFTKNKTFTLLEKYADINMYKEKFLGEVSAKINKEKILASLDLESRKASIKTQDTKLDTLKETIDSKIAVVANTHSINIGLSGKTSKPKVSVDMKKLMKSKAGDKAKKEVGRLLKKLF